MKYQKILIEVIKKHIPECKIYLFGSRARGTNAPCADVDLAVDAGKPIGFHVIAMIKEEIEERNIPFFVDVVDLYSASDVFKGEVKRDGILWSN